MEVVKKKLSELTEIGQNVRRHSDKQIREYIRSVKMFGQIRPIVVDENNEIIAGNGLHRAMMEAGYETADCYVVKGLSPEQKKKLMLADNKVYELGYTDMNAFQEIIAGIDDVDIPGFDSDLLEMLKMSSAEATRQVMDYGKHEAANRAEPTDVVEEHQIHGAKGLEAYAEAPAAEEKASVKRYVICPHCGGKVEI